MAVGSIRTMAEAARRRGLDVDFVEASFRRFCDSENRGGSGGYDGPGESECRTTSRGLILSFQSVSVKIGDIETSWLSPAVG
jgi:hypothetical protein